MLGSAGSAAGSAAWSRGTTPPMQVQMPMPMPMQMQVPWRAATRPRTPPATLRFGAVGRPELQQHRSGAGRPLWAGAARALPAWFLNKI